jgi:hypothetical protein
MRTLQGLLRNINAPANASGVVNDGSPRQPDDNAQLDFTGSSLRQILLVQGSDTVPNDVLPEIDSDEWEGLELDPFESDAPLVTENSSMNDQDPLKQQQNDVDDDENGEDQSGNNNLFLGLAAVGAAAIGVAAVALVGQHKNNDTSKNDSRQTAQRSRSQNPKS